MCRNHPTHNHKPTNTAVRPEEVQSAVSKGQEKQSVLKKGDEYIFVVKREHLFTQDAWHGIEKKGFEHYLQCAFENQHFMPRSAAETDPTYKQIIPYLIFEYNNLYFLMQRRHDASETRLQNKWSLGIGGHVRQEDITSLNLFDWARREFHEEVIYNGTLRIEPLGVINDDSNDVGKVHIGFALLLKGNTPDIKIRSELKSGELVSLQTCLDRMESLESWSQLVVNELKKTQPFKIKEANMQNLSKNG